MLRSEQRRPSCAMPAQLLASPQLTLIYRRGLRRHALKLALTRKPREHNRGAAH